MVTSVTSLGRNGLYDWLIQRVTALILGVYFIFTMGWLMTHSGVDYLTWKAFMGSLCMQIANTLVFFSVSAHAWVGLWTVTTDYITTLQFGSKATFARLTAQLVIALLTLVYLLWGLVMIWGGA
ncbi:MAG: succinate dehydrogenase, hydrophobic membrane anchor protein [Alcanivoracaceae bacterium]|nr:succinate dehydrogenase, hydrophobic membrane anchor protein [Alcanivoracaceae bacterium]